MTDQFSTIFTKLFKGRDLSVFKSYGWQKWTVKKQIDKKTL